MDQQRALISTCVILFMQAVDLHNSNRKWNFQLEFLLFALVFLGFLLAIRNSVLVSAAVYRQSLHQCYALLHLNTMQLIAIRPPWLVDGRECTTTVNENECHIFLLFHWILGSIEFVSVYDFSITFAYLKYKQISTVSAPLRWLV